MKKFFLILILIILSVAIGLNWEQSQDGEDFLTRDRKGVLLRFAMVSDSENDNALLAGALSQAKGTGVNFVIGLGDWSSVGTIRELTATRRVFDESGLTYYLIPGDHDLWDSRNQGLDATSNFRQVFGDPTQVIDEDKIQFVLLDNSDIYLGIDEGAWLEVSDELNSNNALTFFFSHKTPFHPQSAHVMGEDREVVADQANEYVEYLEKNSVEGFFSGDLHFFAQFRSPNESVKITTIGAVNETRNFQGPRFAIVTVFDDYSWEVSDVEIR